MPPSQLKALKSQLREKGIVGPQKSKKQKQQHKSRQSGQERQANLQAIRDNFNPFELRPGGARPAKFPSASVKDATQASGRYKQVLHRPGVTKSAGEEMRRQQLLPEMRARSKVGGLVDRRIGEGDAGMTAEERAVRRFAKEKSGKSRGSLFDLEGSDDDAKVALTHGGRSLDELAADDFVDDVSDGSGSDEDGGFLRRKRPRSDLEDDEEDELPNGEVETDQPDRKKTKKEVMTELIAKSKLHKYERQKVKEDDDDLREQLDAGMADIMSLLQGHQPLNKAVPKDTDAAQQNGSGPQMDPGRLAMMEGKSREQADKEYEKRLRELRQDTRAQPSERTKTAEEKALDEAKRLREMEERRAKRMRGEQVDEDGSAEEAAEEDDEQGLDGSAVSNEEEMPDEAADFGFTASAPQAAKAVDIEDTEHADEVQPDEDQFDMDDDLIASEPEDVELSEDEEDSNGSSDDDEEHDGEHPRASRRQAHQEDEEDEFVKGILGSSDNNPNAAPLGVKPAASGSAGLAYTYPCPRTHAELLEIIKDVPLAQLPTVVQRIRALYHPSLSASNKEAMVDFSCALVEHIAYLANHKQDALPVTEQLIRHLHSLSRTYPIEIAEAFRRRLQAWHERGAGKVEKGDLIVLTAIGTIYPTSDHFHQVVTPAVTLMGRWLGSSAEQSWEVGAFMVALAAVKYQALAKRYVPEAVRFTLRVLNAQLGPDAIRPHLDNLVAMADLWKEKLAFSEIFTPFLPILRNLGAKKEAQRLKILLQQARLRRRPLELHHHKKQAIRMSIPKFEEGFNPDKHYDPDKERSDAKKLQKEFKREKKGAVRELRKDANFVAREQLREKREKDEEYERKQRRLVAEIQGEEGHEKKEYERERARRKRGK